MLSEVAMNAKQEGTLIEADGVFIATENFELLSRSAVEEVRSHHQREPLSRGLARETLRERHFAQLAPEVFRLVIARLETGGVLATDKDLVRAREHSLELSPADAQLRERLSALYEKAGLEVPSLDHVFADAGVVTAGRAYGRKILQLLIDDGTLVRVQAEMFIHLRALDRLKELLRTYAAKHEPERLIDVGTFKDLAGVSRKYAIPLLEYLDREHLTRRSGDKRIIV